jgi:hypothetical protein
LQPISTQFFQVICWLTNFDVPLVNWEHVCQSLYRYISFSFHYGAH